MTEKKEKKTRLSHAEIAEELQAAAEDLARGRMRIGRHAVAVGEPIYLKMKQKLEGDTASFSLTMRMPIMKEPVPAQEHLLSLPVGKSEESPMRSQTEAGYGGRKLKKEIGRLWRSASKRIESEQMPDSAETEGLLKRCEEFNLFADGEWQAKWTDCTLAVQKCFIDAAAGDWPAAEAGVSLVNRMIRECHEKYK